jgi:peroxiredoxin
MVWEGLVASLCLLGLQSALKAAPAAGQPAPPVEGETVDGKTVSLAGYRGKSAVLLSFYVNFCPNCRKEYPQLKRLSEQYRGKGVEVLSVSLETNRAQAGKWTRELSLPFPVIFDPKQKIARAYGPRATPLNIAVDRSGKIVKVMEGGDIAGLERVFAELAAGGK